MPKKAENKSRAIMVRVDREQEALLRTAAERRGLNLSTYVRMIALEAARRETGRR